MSSSPTSPPDPGSPWGGPGSPHSFTENGSTKRLKHSHFSLHKRAKKDDPLPATDGSTLNKMMPAMSSQEVVPSSMWSQFDAHIQAHDIAVVVIHVDGATGLLPPRGCKRADPCLQIRHAAFSQKTSVKPKTLNPVWRERLYFLADPGLVLLFEMFDNALDGIVSGGAIIGKGEIHFTEPLLAKLAAGRMPVTIPLQHGGKPAGQLNLQLELSTARNLEPGTLTDELRDITENPKEPQEHHLEPVIRQLRVMLKESSIPSFVGPASDTYLKIQCGLFNVETDVHPTSTKPNWDEEFVIPVPERTIGTNRLPRLLQYHTLDIELWQFVPRSTDTLISRLSLPLPDILGYGGHAVDADNPPWRTYGMSLVGREHVKQRVREVFHSAQAAQSAAILDSTLNAAIFFDTSYDQDNYADCGKVTICLEKLTLQHPAEEVHVVVKTGRHWTKYRAHPIDRSIQVKVLRPRMLITIAVICPIPGSIRQRERVLGVIHLRASMLVPHRWTAVDYPLLTRGKAQCTRHGTLSARLRWDAVPFPKLLGQYTTPALPSRFYSHPWSARQTSLFSKSRMDVIITYLEHQAKPIRPEVVRAVLAQDFNKFEWAILKAHVRRTRTAFHQVKHLASLAKAVMRWENQPVSFAANVAWLLFAFFPREVSTAMLALTIVCIIFHNLRTPLDSRLAMPDALLFGGIAEDASDDDEKRVQNPIKYLSEKIEHFEVSATQAQLLASTVAGVFENIVSAFTMTDYMISNVAVMVMAMVILALWTLPFSIIVAAVGLYVLRHPRFRKPVPSRSLCLLSHLPNKVDTVLYTKGTS